MKTTISFLTGIPKFLGFLLTGILLLPSPLFSNVIVVPTDQPTIQSGIEAASEGDTVLVEEDTYFENINFLGKPIVVASRFILDGDTSHISATIIDGSQAPNPDTSSTVLMISGEDTTSVLAGFTITGGSGTILDMDGWTPPFGGGIAVNGSGGKIIHNIIESNHVQSQKANGGGGIGGSVHGNHILIIRDNIIRQNQCSSPGPDVHGAGIGLFDGKIIIENNTINDNILSGAGNNYGGGIFWMNFDSEGAIPEVYILGNIISGNKCPATEGESSIQGVGGGIFCDGFGRDGTTYISNNIVSGNYAAEFGGGIGCVSGNSLITNNTILNNEAGSLDANSIGILYRERSVLFNNIIRTNAQNSHENIGILTQAPAIPHAYLYNNLLEDTLHQHEYITHSGNTFLEPVFEADSFLLAPNCPAIGRGLDSLQVDGIWYYAPRTDILGNERPGAGDQFIDIGAYESAFSRPLFAEARLVDLVISGSSLSPGFHPDSTFYTTAPTDTATTHPPMVIQPSDGLAQVDINYASDVLSPEQEDRLTTITVASSDGTVQKEYSVLFEYVSRVNTLSSLEVKGYTLDPPFDPEIQSYMVQISDTCTIAPCIVAVATDTSSEIKIYDATFTDEGHMTTRLIVTPTAGYNHRKQYEIHFLATGTYSVPEKLEFRIYPNPVSGLLTIQNYNFFEITVEISALDGQLLYTRHVQGNSHQVDFSEFPKGIYFITLISETQKTTRKIIVH